MQVVNLPGVVNPLRVPLKECRPTPVGNRRQDAILHYTQQTER